MDVENKAAVLAPEPLQPDVHRDGGNRPGQETSNPHSSSFKGLGILDQYLALWIFLAMLVGILLGNFVESSVPALQRGEFVGVSIPIGMSSTFLPFFCISLTVNLAVGLLLMMYPILCKVRFEILHRSFRTRALWIQVAFSVVVNWVIAPLLMVDVHNYVEAVQSADLI